MTRRFARGDVTVVVPTKDEEANIGRFLDTVPRSDGQTIRPLVVSVGPSPPEETW